MFGHNHYVPILKARSGELKALAKVPSGQWAMITPVIEIPPIPSEWPEGLGRPVPSKSIGAHIAKVSREIATALPYAKRFFVDGGRVEQESGLPNRRQPLVETMAVLRDKSLSAVPVVGLNRSFEYITAVRAIQAEDQRGCCLRFVGTELNSKNLGDDVAALLEYLKLSPNQIDVIVDIGPIAEDSVANLRASITSHLTGLPQIEKWRTLTLSATAIPQNLSGVRANSMKVLPRSEWALWNALLKRGSQLKRVPAFGDYVTTHPNPSEIDPRFINKAPSIRYCNADSWIIVKGKGKPKKKRGAASTSKNLDVPAHEVQYPALADQIMNCSDWRGESFSWGDARIAECFRKRAAKKKATGGPPEWISVATSHHIAIVVEQIANLPDAEQSS